MANKVTTVAVAAVRRKKRTGSIGNSIDLSDTQVRIDEDTLTSPQPISTEKVTQLCPECPDSSAPLYKVHLFVSHPEAASKEAKLWHLLVVMAVLLATVAIIASSAVEWDNASWQIFEYCIAIFFTVELLLRLMSSGKKSVFIQDWVNWIDFLAVLPFYVNLVLENDFAAQTLEVIRVFRLIRVVRLLKVGRYFLFLHVFKNHSARISRSIVIVVFLCHCFVGHSWIVVCIY